MPMPYERPVKVKNNWWVKMWADDVLNGSMLAQGTLEDLGFMTAMVCLSTKCRGDYGWVQANPECAFSHQGIANRITGGNLQRFEYLLKKMIKEERLSEVKGRGIFICNMEYYQLIKGVKDPNGNGSKPQFTPDPVSQVMQDVKAKKAAAKGVINERQTAIDQLKELGYDVIDRATGEVIPTRFDKENPPRS
jgi:hypothetical protein